MAATYSGPDVREMLDSHTLAKEITERHDGPIHERILDGNELSRLRRWCADPSAAEQILRENKSLIEPEREPRSKSQGGSLVCYLIAQSLAGNDLLTKAEFEQLKEWFQKNPEPVEME